MTDKYAALRPRRDRQCYRADGVPKKRYRRVTARVTAARWGQDAYRCGECGHWHTGGKTTTKETP
ncbi:hypothetical protein [Jiangella asiatica]|uniref:Uncharacterized protein n=1 Tax=Jiangella asiatica TaxID=2530372 RepID=A0A4R5CWN9_9ACTN|nr:hypothetical protein [Jiangella asiatica]TDE03451.1 hypothetical protein E1269_20660 [Jiangella asiatica]